MTQNQPATDSPSNWVAEHTQRYAETNGEDGHLWRGAPTLLLTVKGRRTGQWRRTALIYGQDGDRYLLVASRGGADEHPQWYLNLDADSEVQVQVLGDKFEARARTASPDEKRQLWPIMAAVWPAYDEYQAKTSRDIPLIILERA